MFVKIIISISLFLLNVDLSEQFTSGAPAGTCNSLLPSLNSHGPPQTTPSPYVVTVSKKKIENGEKLLVNISSTQEGRFFRGFLLQARTTEDPFTILGEFQSTDDFVFNFRNCMGHHTAVTQANSQPLESLTFEWAAPWYFTGIIRFHMTMLEDLMTHWVNQISEEIEVITAEAPSTLPPSPPTTTTIPELPHNDLIYYGCGETKTCFGIGDGDCVTNRRCQTIGAVTYDEGSFYFEMQSSRTAKYVAFALSDDDRMGDDSVIECVVEGGLIEAYTSLTYTQTSFASPRIENQEIIRMVQSRYEDGMIYCQVERDAITNIENLSFNLIDDRHFLLLASGTSVTINSVDMHDIDEDATDSAILLTEITIVRGRSRVMVYIHASFMIIAWIGFTSVGVFTSRFMKKSWTNVKICGKDLWFVIHQTLMILTWLLTLAGFIIIVIDSNRWNDNAHAILGTIAFCLCMIQPFGAAFRPGPKDSYRPIFNFLHKFAGNMAHALTIITIFYASRMSRAHLPEYFNYILIAFVTTYVTFYTSMTVLGILSDKKADEDKDSAKQLIEHNVGDAPFSTIRKTLYIVFVLLMIGFLLALTIIAASTS